jgi:4-amino-4-deoxy-L-arabinose transferase-like glycosyltransferase
VRGLTDNRQRTTDNSRRCPHQPPTNPRAIVARVLNRSLLLRVWLVVGALALAMQLGSVPLMDADEGRNAEVAREMAETNDYVMPRLDGLPYLDKPVVYFAAEAAVMEVLGPTETAARLPAYLFTIATALLLFWYTRNLVAPIVFLSMPLVIAFARTVIFDSALMFFTTLALIAFHRALEERNTRWSMLAWAAMGFAMITKGPVTFVLVLFVVVPFAIWRKALRIVFPLLGVVLFFAIALPWVWGVTRVVPEFLRYVLVTETAARMATDQLKRTGPPWYFLPYLIGGALPWSIVALANWKKFRKPDPALVYWLLAIAIPFLFFSLSQSKRPQYIVPLMPVLAILIARVWEEARTRAAAITLTLLGALLVIASFFVHRTKLKPAMMAIADETAIAFGIVFLLGGLIALFAKRREIALMALTLPTFALPLIATPMLHAVAESRSTKSFVAQLAPKLTPQTEVIGIEAFTGSMMFYLGRPITVITKDASELTSNYLIRRYERFTTNPASPLKPMSYLERSLAATHPRVYVVRLKDTKWQRLLEARGWKPLAFGSHHVAYGRDSRQSAVGSRQ